MEGPLSTHQKARYERQRTPWVPWHPLAWACVVFLCVCLQALAAEFKTTLDSDTVEAGESTVLNLVFEDLDIKGAPQLPPIANATVEYLGPSILTRIINGVLSPSITHKYRVTPKQPGEVQIPGLQIQIGGKPYTSGELTLKVTKTSVSDGSSGEDSLVFLKILLPREEVYYGETFPIEVRLYTALQIREFSPAVPKLGLDGFVISKTTGGQQTQITLKGRPFTVVTWRMAAATAKLGTLQLGPAEADDVIQVPTRPNNRRRDPFGMLDDFFGTAELRRVHLTSATNLVKVIPVPANGKPAEYTGAVGKFQLEVEASPTQVAVGEPITVRIRITGEGNVESMPPPRLAETRGWKSYPPSESVESTDPLGIQGTKTFEAVLEPENADLKEIPEIRFVYFDPEARKYVTLSHPPIPVRIRPSSVAQASPSRQAVTGEPLSPAVTAKEEFRHIKPVLGVGGLPSQPLPMALWTALVVLPVVLFGLFSTWMGQRERRNRDPLLQRRLQAQKAIADGMVALEKHAACNQAPEFFAALAMVLQERIGLTLGVTAAGITEEVLGERLRPRGLPEDEAQRVAALFEAINQARYAPGSTVAQLEELRQQAALACKALDQLEAVP